MAAMQSWEISSSGQMTKLLLKEILKVAQIKANASKLQCLVQMPEIEDK